MPRVPRTFLQRRMWARMVRRMSSSNAEPLPPHMSPLSRVRGRFPSALRTDAPPRLERTPTHQMARQKVQKTRTPGCIQ